VLQIIYPSSLTVIMSSGSISPVRSIQSCLMSEDEEELVRYLSCSLPFTYEHLEQVDTLEKRRSGECRREHRRRLQKVLSHSFFNKEDKNGANMANASN
jgi:hypothetical protein